MDVACHPIGNAGISKCRRRLVEQVRHRPTRDDVTVSSRACPRRANIEPPCRPNSEPGVEADV